MNYPKERILPDHFCPESHLLEMPREPYRYVFLLLLEQHNNAIHRSARISQSEKSLDLSTVELAELFGDIKLQVNSREKQKFNLSLVCRQCLHYAGKRSPIQRFPPENGALQFLLPSEVFHE